MNDNVVRVDVNERQVLEQVISVQREKAIKISQSWRYKGMFDTNLMSLIQKYERRNWQFPE